jgi:hypothetical protein
LKIDKSLFYLFFIPIEMALTHKIHDKSKNIIHKESEISIENLKRRKKEERIEHACCVYERAFEIFTHKHEMRSGRSELLIFIV